MAAQRAAHGAAVLYATHDVAEALPWPTGSR